MTEDEPQLSFEELQSAAEGDLRIWAVVMFIGSVVVSIVGVATGLLDIFSLAVLLTSSATTSYLVWNRSPLVCSWVAISYRLAPILAVVAAALGIVLGIRGVGEGWLLLAGAVVSVPISLIGLEIIHRAEEYGVVSTDRRLL